MKTIATSFSLIIFSSVLFSQNVKRIENLKDAWDITYTYTGEVKDGKPSGMGFAKYNSGNVLRYVGSFTNGLYNGKGTMFFDNGAFLTGEWKNGKLNGRGTNLTGDGSLYIGEFVNGLKNGRGILIYKNNGAMIASFREDRLNGRAIRIWEDGNIISDCNYANDKLNGKGFQYEAKTKKLYEGEWQDDKWVQAASAGFSTFLKASNFTSEMDDTHVLIGNINESRFLQDTSYYYDLAKKKRYFGFYTNGHLKNGLIIRDDSTRFIGPIGDQGAEGYCYDFKFNKYYSEGNYSRDYLDGKIVDLDLEKKSVYYGDAVHGEYTGKAWFFNDKGTMFAGDYVKGRFTGNGYRLEADGRYTAGAWEDGKIVKLASLITSKGELISGNPKTFAEGINIVIKTFPDLFDDINGQTAGEEDDMSIQEELDENGDLDFTYSLVNIPGSDGKNMIADDYDENTYYYARFLNTDNAAKAKAKYNELANMLKATVISNAYLTGKQKLTGTMKTPDLSGEITESDFTVTGGDSDYKDFHVWLRIRKSDNKYNVEILSGQRGDK